MSKGRRGNKEARKPKQAKKAIKPPEPNGTTPAATAVDAPSPKKS